MSSVNSRVGFIRGSVDDEKCIYFTYNMRNIHDLFYSNVSNISYSNQLDANITACMPLCSPLIILKGKLNE